MPPSWPRSPPTRTACSAVTATPPSYLDETSFVKKGDHSVGVQRQYCGQLGKTENCHVGVFACLGHGHQAALVDFRLFLPAAWAEDEARCDRAKVPEPERVHRTKPALALEIIKAARARGSRHRWICADEVYGSNHELCRALDELGETWLMDIPATTRLWSADPAPAVPESSPRRARPFSVTQQTNSAAEAASARALTEKHFPSARRNITLRETTKGPLRAALWVCPVWQGNPGEAAARRRLLIVRRESDGSYKYSLSNAPDETAWERLGRIQAHRYWIEHAFKEAKSELGLGHYEVRGWRGWHHHMAMVCLAQLFTVRERAAAAGEVPLLSTRDIVELLQIYLPRRARDEREELRQMTEPHQRRRQAIESHTRATRKRQRQEVKP